MTHLVMPETDIPRLSRELMARAQIKRRNAARKTVQIMVPEILRPDAMTAGPYREAATLFLYLFKIDSSTEGERTDDSLRNAVRRGVVTVEMPHRFAPFSVRIWKIDMRTRAATRIQFPFTDEFLRHREDVVAVDGAADDILAANRRSAVTLANPRVRSVPVFFQRLPNSVKGGTDCVLRQRAAHDKVAVLFEKCFVLRC